MPRLALSRPPASLAALLVYAANMTRLEFRDSKSAKFWEVDTEGCTDTTRWGRIGANRQTKSKDCVCVEAALKEAEKQTLAKVKKGYVEVGTDSNATLAPVAPKPVTSPSDLASEDTPALPDEDTFVLPSSWKARLHPRRGGKYVPDGRYNVKEQFARLKKQATARSIKLPEAWNPEEWTQEDLQKLGNDLPANEWADDPGNEALVRLVLETKGIMPALRLAREHSRFSKSTSSLPPTLRTMRMALALCSAEDLAQATSYLEQRLTTGVGCAASTAYLIPEQSAWLTKACSVAGHINPAFLCTCPPSLADVLQLTNTSYDGDGVAETLAVEFGAETVPVLIDWLVRAWDVDTKNRLAMLLSHIPDDSVAIALFDNIAEKPALRALPGLFQRFPQRCIRLAASRSDMKAYLAGWVASHPAAAQAVQASASPAIAKAIEKLRANQGPTLPEASLDTLHPLFANPPWARKTKRTKAVVVDLKPVLPPPEGRLNDTEVSLAHRALQRSASMESVSDYAIYLDEDSRTSDQWLGVFLYGDAATRVQVTKRIVQTWWSGRDAQELGYGLILGAPEQAGAILEAAQMGSPELLDTMVALADPVTAATFLQALDKKTQRPLAVKWLARHPEYASRAWIPVACSSAKKARRVAEDGLRLLSEQGHEGLIRRVAAEYGEPAAGVIDIMLAADPLERLPKRPPTTISFFNAAALPRPKLKNKALVLPLPALETLARVFAVSTLSGPYNGVAVARAELESASLAKFAWGMFEQWLSVGAPSKESWAMRALGLVGDDETAGKLTRYIRAWPGEALHQRAVAGLDVLLAIGTDVALMHLDGIAQKVKFRAIKKNARERIAQLAATLNLSAEQLADRLVPSLGLEADGTLLLNYGPRTFTVGFDEALKPFVKDDSGKLRKSLPKPGAKDDANLAIPAEASFKLLKKNVRTLASIQVARLRNAMILGRRWTAEDFDSYLVKHPLLVHLVRRLVWGVYEEGVLTQTFRVTEDRTLGNAEDDELSLAHGASVGLIHAIDLSAEPAGAWGELFTDYGLLQPFQQLGRPVFLLSEQEKAAHILDRHKGKKIPVGRVMGLMSRGWDRGEPQDGGLVRWLSMPLQDGIHELRLWLGEAGLWTGTGGGQDDDPSIEGVSVVKKDSWTWNVVGEMPLGTLPKALMSEVLDTLDSLAADP